MRRWTVRAFLISAMAACGSGQSTPDAPIDCSAVEAMGGADVFTVGLEKKGAGGSIDFKLMSVNPAPPARGDNSWVLQINAMSGGTVGSPLTGASMMVTPFMPAHQHGTPVPVQIMPMPTAGQYTLDPVNMWMPGVWDVTIVASVGATTDQAKYSFCIPN